MATATHPFRAVQFWVDGGSWVAASAEVPPCSGFWTSCTCAAVCGGAREGTCRLHFFVSPMSFFRVRACAWPCTARCAGSISQYLASL